MKVARGDPVPPTLLEIVQEFLKSREIWLQPVGWQPRTQRICHWLSNAVPLKTHRVAQVVTVRNGEIADFRPFYWRAPAYIAAAQTDKTEAIGESK